jgi:intein/homing endonuclease
MPDSQPWQPRVTQRQAEAINLIRRGDRMFTLLSGPRLTGKCVSPGTIIYTADGLCRMGTIVGNAPDGFSSNVSALTGYDTVANKTKVVLTSHAYKDQTTSGIEITCDTGHRITCSEAHPIWCECLGLIGYKTALDIKNLIDQGVAVWIAMLESHPNWTSQAYQSITYCPCGKQDKRRWEFGKQIDELVAQIGNKPQQIKTKLSISYETVKAWISGKRPSRPLITTVLIDEELAYAIGLMIGDGCLTTAKTYQASPSFTSGDDSVISELSTIIAARFDDFSIRRMDQISYSICSRSFSHFLDALGLIGKYAHEKTVPDAIIQSPKSVVKAFLQGLFDTDGTSAKLGHVSYCSTSEELALDVQRLLAAFGIKSVVRPKKTKCRVAWNVCLHHSARMFYEHIGFRLLRKQQRSALLFAKKNGTWRRPTYPPSLRVVLNYIWKERYDRGVGTYPRKQHKLHISPIIRGDIDVSKQRLDTFCKIANCAGDLRIEQYRGSGNLWWAPVSACSNKTTKLLDVSVPETQNFIGNGIINHNTVGALEIVADHAWLTPNANFAVVSLTQSAGYDSGVWTDLIETTLPNWMTGGFGMKWIKPPSVQGVSKKPYCIVSNSFGGKSKFQLESLKNEEEVEARFKSKRYTGMFVNELSNFKKRKTFETWTECLRTIGLPRDKHLFLADTNPADEGTKSWIYKLWFVFPNLTEIDGRPLTPEEKWLQRQLRVITFTLDDNTLIDPDRIMQLKASLSGNPDLYARYVLGKWVTASMDALFVDVFKERIHVVPDPTAPDALRYLMIPEENCYSLLSGWDIGVRNSSAHVIEKTVREIPGSEPVSVFKVLDELAVIGEDHGLEDFTTTFVEQKMDYWEQHTSQPTRWKHWSDRSAFDMKDPEHNRYHHQTVFLASDGRIELNAAARGRDSVQQRIDLLRKLLFQNRIYISADRCPLTIEMLKSIRRGKSSVAAIEKGSPHKHLFDSLMYAIASECVDEMQDSIYNHVRSERKESGVVSIATV